MNPTVSAVIPTYNRAHLIKAALESVFTQTHRVNEIIVVDDGSTDNTAGVIASLGASVRYIRQENAGPGAARNRGMREARSDFIAFLDSDDLWVPQKVALQLEMLRAHPVLDFIFGDMANFTANSDNAEAEIKNHGTHRYCVDNAADLKELYECLVVDNTIPTPTVLYRRSCVERVGFFDQELRIAEDLEYWLRVSLLCRCGFLNRVLAKRFRHEGNLINNWAQCNESHAQVLERTLLANPNLSVQAKRLTNEKLAKLYYDLGSHYFKRHNFSRSQDFFQKGSPRHAFDWKRSLKLRLSSLLRRMGRTKQPPG